MLHRCGHHLMTHSSEFGIGLWPGMLLSTLSTLLLIALFIGLAWSFLRWISPYILPVITDTFGLEPANPSALEILRQRYAAGEIDTVTFEQMRERLEASYQQDQLGIPTDGSGSQRETWTGY